MSEQQRAPANWRRHNAGRQRAANARLLAVLRLYGTELNQADIALKLGVDRSMISRDLKCLHHLFASDDQRQRLGRPPRAKLTIAYRAPDPAFLAGLERVLGDLKLKGHKP